MEATTAAITKAVEQLFGKTGTKNPGRRAQHQMESAGIVGQEVSWLHEEKSGVPASRVLAVGDSFNDLRLLKKAGVGIAYESKSVEVENSAARFVRGDRRQVLDLCNRVKAVAA